MAKTNPKPTPQKRNTAKAKPRSRGSNTIEGDVSGGAFVVGENHGTVISVGGDKQSERFNALADGLIERIMSDLESNYTTKGGKK